ncbi:MAG: bifunctional pyr operon transcriptional regulator/uracil phosphoribosyltransferase PyrR [Gammaproteobacteria bacterium]|nr:bifunctional pyr operon transcriptional regulator/uracil phosphoribosyltransferase PyrR [Gammaproteobacteria bacterium]MDX2458968.1 bifunctional pyr operon transcriptional regulator/uracil phosphoribosyltransferase PyrR [Gammaproteobacteria bacterium]
MSDPGNVDTLIAKLAETLAEHLARHHRDAPLMIGVHTGGVWVARKVHRLLGIEAPLGTLNINFYRDDFTRIGMHPMVTPSDLFSVDDRHVVLIDDVLHTGRTIRAALNEIFDYGRPASVTLGVLVERSGREIPVQADAIGDSLDLADHEYVKLRGPESLSLEITRKS